MSLYNSNGTTGALLENDMYAWIAEGAGRMDLSSEIDMTFSYADVVRKAKNKIVNPLGHIQFAASLKQLRYMFMGNSGGGSGCAYTVSDMNNRDEINAVTDASLGHYRLTEKVEENAPFTNETNEADVSYCEKFLIAPFVDEFSLIPHLVADLSENGYQYNLEKYGDNTDISFSNLSYANVSIAFGETGTPNINNNRFANGTNLSDGTTQDAFNFNVIDLSNQNTDGSYNVIAAFNIYMKYGDKALGGTDETQLWPKDAAGNDGLPPVNSSPSDYPSVDGVTDSESNYFSHKMSSIYHLNGVPIDTYGRKIIRPVRADQTNHSVSLNGGGC